MSTIDQCRRDESIFGQAALTFLPSGMAERSTSTLAMANTSADADMFLRNSVAELVSPALAESLVVLVTRLSEDPIVFAGANWLALMVI